MAGQPLIARAAFFLVCLLTACDEETRYDGAFSMPVTAAVLSPTGSPRLFDEPVGFVVDGIGGRVHPLALKQGRPLTDDPTAAFLPAHALATGTERLLDSAVVLRDGATNVDVFLTDRRFSQLLRVPYIVGIERLVEGDTTRLVPKERRAYPSAPVLYAEDGTVSERASLRLLQAHTGFAATEEWSLRYDGDDWTVTGTRSGRQQQPAITGEPYRTEGGAVSFTVRGTPKPGDIFRFGTSNGTQEYDMPGVPSHLAHRKTTGELVLTLAADGVTGLHLFDIQNGVLSDSLLPPEAIAGRVVVEESTQAVLTGDERLPILWEIDTDNRVVAHSTPWPILDVTPLFSDTDRMVHLVPLGSSEVWRYDLDAGSLVDVNPRMPGDQGIAFSSPVNGIEALPMQHLYVDETDQGVRRSGRSVAVTLQEGKLLFVEEETGCLMADGLGPRTRLSSDYTGTDYTRSYDGIPGTAALEPTDGSGRHVTVYGCAGVVQSQIWTLRFDANQQHWTVEGTKSGEQTGVALEDQRYVSDDGTISFVIRSGSVATEDGWKIQFQVDSGSVSINGDQDGDGIAEIRFRNPGDPIFFHYRVGSDDGGWKEVDERPFVLVPIQGSNLVGRADPQEGDLDVTWQ